MCGCRAKFKVVSVHHMDLFWRPLACFLASHVQWLSVLLLSLMREDRCLSRSPNELSNANSMLPIYKYAIYTLDIGGNRSGSLTSAAYTYSQRDTFPHSKQKQNILLRSDINTHLQSFIKHVCSRSLYLQLFHQQFTNLLSVRARSICWSEAVGKQS